MEERILILAPRGRDAAVVEQVLSRSGTSCEICADVACLADDLLDGAGAVLLTEEALSGPLMEPLLIWCEAQPAWSDMPFIVLASRQIGRRPDAAAQILDRLGNVMLLERPINAETLTSAVRAALRGRRRQYQARGLLRDQERGAEALRLLNETLEQRVEERTQELESARDTLAFALQSAGMGSWDLDLASDRSRRSIEHDMIFGYSDGLPNWGRIQFLEHVVPEDKDAVTAAFDDAGRSGTLDIECRVRRPDGTMRWIAAKGRVEYDAAGAPVRMAGIVTDITDRRVTEDVLHQAQKMEAIGQLTGGVAHDFNNLLTVIVGGLDMVIRRPEQTERVVRLAEAAMTAARRGEQLTQQLLAFSRRQMLRPETLNPNRLLLDFETLARRAVGEAVTLRLDLDPAIDPIRIDPAQFESAVLNLIVNARDAMPNGGAVTVQSRNVHRDSGAVAGQGVPPGQYVMVAVTDDGSGIDAETLAHAFEPFFTTKEVGKGSGLGLSQVYGFARSAGGDVAIESEEGAGTTVRLFFPRSSASPAEARDASPTKVPLRPATSGETVLLVEDDEQVLTMAVESLEELRYKIVVARNAREALDHLNGPERIDILFSDVVMPGGMNGAQLAVEARRLRPELKILLTSGYVGELAEQAIDPDMPVLSKPYRRDELARQLRVVLGGA
jgi:signal transduction histidine kinase/CheY-like chemotaxis protein